MFKSITLCITDHRLNFPTLGCLTARNFSVSWTDAANWSCKSRSAMPTPHILVSTSQSMHSGIYATHSVTFCTYTAKANASFNKRTAIITRGNHHSRQSRTANAHLQHVGVERSEARIPQAGKAVSCRPLNTALPIQHNTTQHRTTKL